MKNVSIETMFDIIVKREKLIQRLCFALRHLPVEQIVMIATSGISMEELERLVTIQEAKSKS